ncbi:hypothetical protein [Roseibium aggregatum]|uniref:Membrane-bound lysozyme inhibitor of c-type lysozyme MliC n=1 Tax=Roseibium aggregatum TaxID=187304 RepID=A0A939EHI7_9HYPH|nr:hypothetical protein [Roseibium aggregatum]MBN9672368.1 hypothetical protein [Roseibium aggregatum]
MRKLAPALLLVIAPLLAGESSPVQAQQFLDERSYRCLDYEMEVWGDKERKTLFRNETSRLPIARGQPVVWFCGRQRNEFSCHRDADLLEIAWDGKGQVMFGCLRQ